MPTYTGTEIARGALREAGVLDPVEQGDPELLNDALTVGTDMLDSWRLERLMVPSVTRSVYPLVINTQSYTLGSGGTFNQDYPTAIPMWSVIPDDTVTDPVELPMGEPYTIDQWQAVRIKSQTSPYPTRLFFDHGFVAHLGRILVHPIPDNSDCSVVLYSAIPALTSLAAATQYDLRPGYAFAIKMNLANLLVGRHGKPEPPKLETRAKQAKGKIKSANIHPQETPMRSEFAIGSGANRRTFNIYTGSS